MEVYEVSKSSTRSRSNIRTDKTKRVSSPCTSLTKLISINFLSLENLQFLFLSDYSKWISLSLKYQLTEEHPPPR